MSDATPRPWLCWVVLLVACASPRTADDWVAAFGYAPHELHAIEIGEFGYPFVPVEIAGSIVPLPFDTGNMLGLSVSSSLFDELDLPADRAAERFDSAGRLIDRHRVADGVQVAFLGRDLGTRPVSEFVHRSLPGLAGPTLLASGRFTLDYAGRRMAYSADEAPRSVAGFDALPLVRSSRHPRLILVRGTVEGRRVLLEIDSGKSRSVVNPELARELGLRQGPRGVAIAALSVGALSFAVPSAKLVDQGAIDPELPEPILAGVGSDLLSRFVWTVDCDAGLLWVPRNLSPR